MIVTVNRITEEMMAEIQALFVHYEWDLAEVSCTPHEQEEQEMAALYKWVIDVDKEHWDCAFYHVDLPSSEVSIPEQTRSEDGFIHLHLKIRHEQQELVQQFMIDNGIQRMDDLSTEDDSSLNLLPGYRIIPSPDAQQCELCLCQPCVLDETNRQTWWPTESTALSMENSYLRKNFTTNFTQCCITGGCGAMLSIWREKRQQDIKQDSSEKSCQNVLLQKSEFGILSVVISNTWDTGGCKQRN